MNNIEKIEKAASKASPPMPGDYERDGLLYCGKCHEPKQCRISFDGNEKVVSCACSCTAKEPDNKERIEQLQQRGGISPSYTFDRAQQSKVLSACRRYAIKWDEMQSKNIGLLLWGGVGCGKTYAGHCICNELIKQGIPAFVTSLSRVLNTSGFDKSDILERVQKTPLVVFDDLGAERASNYAVETVFTLIDERYRARKPLIVTSNLTLDELKNARDLDRKRIYDRVLGRCVPLHFDGGSKREEEAAELAKAARELLTED